MSILKPGRTVMALALAAALPGSAAAQSKRKVLVVMSSAHELELRDGKKYQTGYYLNEFVVPYRKLIEAGYEPVIANPNGNRPVMDANSNNAMFFGRDDAKRAEALAYAQNIEQLRQPRKLASVVGEGTDDYVGLFIPGGHAPMADLITDKNLGKILVSFHMTGRPTGIICHGPIVLLSALPDPEAFTRSLVANDGKANSLAQEWPYVGYRLTVFSTGEEQALEGSNGLGGNVQFYPVNALAEAGAHVDTVANWQSNVIVDRELVTAQQPMSASDFGDTLVAMLDAHKR